MNRKCILGAQIGPYLETIYSRNLEVHSEVSEGNVTEDEASIDPDEGY